MALQRIVIVAIPGSRELETTWISKMNVLHREKNSKFSRAARINYHKLVGLKTTEIYSLSVLKTRSSKLRCWQGHGLSEGSLKNTFLASS